jgi:uncharacterized protein (DUF2249 family)|tara:strand:+ start:394 stop:606 length:213 start_codon:yes stop_codon:yes gene_type:complete
MTQIEDTMKKITRKIKIISQLEDKDPTNEMLIVKDHELQMLFHRLALQKLGLDWSEVKALVQDIERQYTR